MNAPDLQIEKLRSLLKDFPTAMLITHCAAGQLHARPMAVAEVADDCSLWFITGDNTATAWEVSGHKEAHVVLQNGSGAFLSIAGTAMLVHDRKRVKELWQEPFRVWFPGGLDDPSLVLVVFRPTRAEYWDNTGSPKISHLWEACVKEGAEHGVLTLA